MHNCDALRLHSLSRVAAILFALPIVILTFAASAFAQTPAGSVAPTSPPAATSPPATTQPPSARALKDWRDGMAHVPPAKEGCFTSSYPNTQWQEAPCVAGPAVPFPPLRVPPLRVPPVRGPGPSTVGGGTDPTPAVTTGHISTAIGSFDSVSGVTSVTSTFGADDFALQLNVNTFSSPICNGAGTPSQCVGWQQFIFANLSCSNGTSQIPCTFMQYWLIGWGSTTCPQSWTYYNNDGDEECYMSTNAVVPPQQPVANLGNLSVVAQANSGGLDTVIFSSGNNLYMVQNNDNVLGLAGGWTAIEYNLVGDCCGNEATFNSGSSIVVRASVDNGSPLAPSCVSASFSGYTAETNNLYLQPASGTVRSSTLPAIVFTQSSNVTSTSPCQSGVAVAAASKLVDTHDFNGDGFSDIVWRDGTNTAVWLMSGATILSSAGVGSVPTTWSIVGQRDFDGNGTYDLLWRDTSGDTAIWFLYGTQVSSSAGVGNIPTNWTVVGTGDFNGDGKGDILWEDNSGNLAVWLMNGAAVLSSGGIGNVPPSVWTVAGIGDFNGDHKSDILWRDTSGDTSIWFMNGTQVSSATGVGNIPTTWMVVGTGDFNGDGKSDIAWRDGSGNTSIWLMNGASVSSSKGLGNIPIAWSIVQTGDFNGDGKSDLLWRDTSGDTAIWFMNGTAVSSTAGIGNIPAAWTLQGTHSD